MNSFMRTLLMGAFVALPLAVLVYAAKKRNENYFELAKLRIKASKLPHDFTGEWLD